MFTGEAQRKTRKVLRSHAEITSHCLRQQCGAGTLACRVETHLDPLRERHPPSRSAEMSLGAADKSVCATTLAAKLFLRASLGNILVVASSW